MLVVPSEVEWSIVYCQLKKDLSEQTVLGICTFHKTFHHGGLHPRWMVFMLRVIGRCYLCKVQGFTWLHLNILMLTSDSLFCWVHLISQERNFQLSAVHEVTLRFYCIFWVYDSTKARNFVLIGCRYL